MEFLFCYFIERNIKTKEFNNKISFFAYIICIFTNKCADQNSCKQLIINSEIKKKKIIWVNCQNNTWMSSHLLFYSNLVALI